jgi:hypothetical protein
MNLRTGFEQLRVAHALSKLPEVTEAFAAGRISYSKVRAITRVATPATETALLGLALAGTATHVERVVRHTRQADADPVAAARRELQWRWDDDGTLVLRGRFTAEQGTRLVAAIAALTEPPGGPETCGCADDDCTGVGGTGEDRRAHSADQSEVHHAGNGHRARPAGHQDVCAILPIAARRADALIALACGEQQVDTQLVVVIDADANAGSGSARLRGGPAIPMRTAERIGCNARVRALVRDRRGNPLHLGRTRRLASPAQVAALHIRDQGRCRFPGCDQTRHLQAHHIVHWLRGGRTDLDNLMLICGHHHRLIHDHGYRVRGRGTKLTFHRPDGGAIEPSGAPTCGNVEGLVAGHAARHIDGDTITPTWAGERLDLSAVLAGLLPERAWMEVA